MGSLDIMQVISGLVVYMANAYVVVIVHAFIEPPREEVGWRRCCKCSKGIFLNAQKAEAGLAGHEDVSNVFGTGTHDGCLQNRVSDRHERGVKYLGIAAVNGRHLPLLPGGNTVS